MRPKSLHTDHHVFAFYIFEKLFRTNVPVTYQIQGKRQMLITVLIVFIIVGRFKQIEHLPLHLPHVFEEALGDAVLFQDEEAEHVL